MKENIENKLVGHFFAQIRKNGEVIETIERHNLIVNTSCKIIAKALGGVAITGDSAPVDIGIKKIAVGTTTNASITTGWTSSVDKTTLDGTVYSKAICEDDGSPVIEGTHTSYIEYDETNSPNDITFNFYIGTSDFNSGTSDPTLIWEFGLLRNDGTLFSMLSREDQGKNYGIVKSEEVDITGYWKIQVRNTSI